MRCNAILVAALFSAATILPALAADTAQQTAMKTCAAHWKAMSDADKGKTKYQDYMGTCLKDGGKSASSMSSSMSMSSAMKMDAGGSAKCKDGTTVTYKKRQGTCSGHGGVATWM